MKINKTVIIFIIFHQDEKLHINNESGRLSRVGAIAWRIITVWGVKRTITKRKKVILKGKVSQSKDMFLGVPQGSILGPLHFPYTGHI